MLTLRRRIQRRPPGPSSRLPNFAMTHLPSTELAAIMVRLMAKAQFASRHLYDCETRTISHGTGGRAGMATGLVELARPFAEA